MEELDIIKKVFLLGVAKREEGESIDEVMKSLVNTGMFDIDEAKRVLEELRQEQYIVGDNLSMKGVLVANKAEEEFRL
jgi:polyhydroxyalkanoate synthesis regulator phasin